MPKNTITSVFLVIALTFAFMLGLWITDISAGALVMGEEIYLKAMFFSISPNTGYHLGLVLTTASFFALALIAVYHILKERAWEGKKA